MKETWIESDNGLRLKSFIYDDVDSKNLIIYLHGFSGSSSGPFGSVICEDLAKDYLVCRFDFSGQGESEGRFFDSSISNELIDLKHVQDYLISNYDVDKTILLAHSFGGAIALLYSEKHHVDGLIIISGEGDLEKAIDLEFDKQQIEEFEKTNQTKYVNWSRNGEKELLGAQFLKDMKRYSTINAAKSIKVPTLLIHGKADEVIPYSASEEIYELLSGPKDIKLLENEDHTFGAFTDNPRVRDLIKHIRPWLNKYF